MSATIPKTAAYASGIMYPPNLTPALSSILKKSGIETVILFAFHVNTEGDITFNDPPTLIAYDKKTSKSAYQGNAQWPAQLQDLIGPGSTITQIEGCIGGYTTNDFLHIKSIYDSNGKSFANTPLQSNFKLFRSTFPMITLIDMDVEGPDDGNYDSASFIAFCQMLIGLGFGITFCPYENQDYWTGALSALTKSNPGAVKWWNLQCYAGGAGNDADTWAGYITAALPGFKTNGYILVSDWSRFYNTQDQAWEGDCVPAFELQMKHSKGEKSVGGGFLWNVDQVQGYADAIKIHPDPAECSSSDRSLRDYVSAIESGLGL